MSIPVMEPRDLPQPDPEDYPLPISAIHLFYRVDREQYEVVAGEQAEEFDEERPQKLWWHTSASSPQDYNILNQQTGQLESITLSQARATTPNLPGPYRYSEWNPTTTATGGPDGLKYLITSREEAAELEAEIQETWHLTFGTGDVRTQENTLLGNQVSWGTETRRIYELVYPTTTTTIENCGQLLRRKYQRGIGYPGEWRFDGSFPPMANWIPGVPPNGSGIPELAIPVRGLYPGEEIRQVGPTGKWVVDLKGGSSPGTGNFTPSDRRLLTENNDILKRVFGGNP